MPLPLWRGLARLALGLLLAVMATGAVAASLSRSEVQGRFPAPLVVLDRLPDLAAWPIVNTALGGEQPVAYAFESVDFAPIPGYEGTPVNLLVMVDGNGHFRDVEVLEQHEPMFVFSGLGDGPLRDFVGQYAGKSLLKEIRIATGGESARQLAASQGGQHEVIDGITKATATVRIVHKSILSSAHAVARARLGFAGQKGGAPPAVPRSDVFEKLSFSQLLARGLVGHRVASSAEVERRFAGSEWAGIEAAAPGEPQVDLYLAYLNAPTVGRALLGEEGYRRLLEKLEPGQAALWLASAGRYSMLGEDFRPGGEAQRLSLAQGGLPLEMRDLVFDLPAMPELPSLESARVFTVFAEAGLDPARPIDLAIRIRRAKGMGIPRIMEQAVHLEYRLPAGLFLDPSQVAAPPEWLSSWRARAGELAVIGASLLLLTWLLARPQAVAAVPRRLRRFRPGFLVFTIGYLGWYAQGQLSIVQLTGALKSLLAGQGLEIFLYDPVSLLLIAFTLASLLIWGRGSFCGWLCPFGALQELVNLGARRLGVRQRRLTAGAQRLARGLRTGLLLVLCLLALVAPRWAAVLVELEPFKTVITVGFSRSWPYLAYAGLLLAVGAVYFRFFCRVLCPLGAALALGGRLRRLDWLPRRRECGRPCQTCRARCDYDALAADGSVGYADCFQCLECVGIYHDPQRCAPVLFLHRKGRRMQVTARGK